MKKYNGLRHGEILLHPISKMPEGKTQKCSKYIVGHSETGHHHVLESKEKFEVMTVGEKEELYLRLFEPAKIVHKKSTDKHNTLTVTPGIYKIHKKREYDPWDQIIREVHD